MTHEDQIRHILDLAAAYRLAERPQAALSKLESSLRAYVQAMEDAVQTPQPAQAEDWQYRGIEGTWAPDWVRCSQEMYEHAKGYPKTYEVRALVIIKEQQ